jgi:hypothetical protein
LVIPHAANLPANLAVNLKHGSYSSVFLVHQFVCNDVND